MRALGLPEDTVLQVQCKEQCEHELMRHQADLCSQQDLLHSLLSPRQGPELGEHSNTLQPCKLPGCRSSRFWVLAVSVVLRRARAGPCPGRVIYHLSELLCRLPCWKCLECLEGQGWVCLAWPPPPPRTSLWGCWCRRENELRELCLCFRQRIFFFFLTFVYLCNDGKEKHGRNGYDVSFTFWDLFAFWIWVISGAYLWALIKAEFSRSLFAQSAQCLLREMSTGARGVPVPGATQPCPGSPG